MPHDSAGGFGDSKASRIVVIGDADGGVGDTDQPIPCVVGGGAGDCGIWNTDHVPGLIVARGDPCGARRVVDRRDLVGLVGRASLYQIPRPVAIRILFEGLPVAGGIQSPLLLEGPGGDCRLRAVQRRFMRLPPSAFILAPRSAASVASFRRFMPSYRYSSSYPVSTPSFRHVRLGARS